MKPKNKDLEKKKSIAGLTLDEWAAITVIIVNVLDVIRLFL